MALIAATSIIGKLNATPTLQLLFLFLQLLILLVILFVVTVSLQEMTSNLHQLLTLLLLILLLLNLVLVEQPRSTVLTGSRPTLLGTIMSI